MTNFCAGRLARPRGRKWGRRFLHDQPDGRRAGVCERQRPRRREQIVPDWCRVARPFPAVFLTEELDGVGLERLLGRIVDLNDGGLDGRQVELLLAEAAEVRAVLGTERGPEPLERRGIDPAAEGIDPASVQGQVGVPSQPQAEPGVLHDLEHLADRVALGPVRVFKRRGGLRSRGQLGIELTTQPGEVRVGPEIVLQCDPRLSRLHEILVLQLGRVVPS